MKKQKSRSPLIVIIVFSALAVFLAALYLLNFSFWIAKPTEKMNLAWNSDLKLLENSRKLPPQWQEIRDVSIKADNSEIQNWIKELRPLIQRNPRGNFRLEVFLVFFIEGYRYGTIVQYHLVDLRNQNTVWEDGRTFKLGVVYQSFWPSNIAILEMRAILNK